MQYLKVNLIKKIKLEREVLLQFKFCRYFFNNIYYNCMTTIVITVVYKHGYAVKYNG